MIKAVHVRPDPVLNSQECSLKVSILPLRLNIDQVGGEISLSYTAPHQPPLEGRSIGGFCHHGKLGILSIFAILYLVHVLLSCV